MKVRCLWIGLGVLLQHAQGGLAQAYVNRMLTPADSLVPARLALVAAGWTAAFGVAFYGLHEAWYKQYPRSSFHLFDDGAEWLQMDKAGHAFTAYFESRWTLRALQWSGLPDRTALWAGAATGFVMQSSIELLDGYSAQWGASLWDLAANAAGSALLLSQELLWQQQRACLKMSLWPQRYPVDLEQRAADLYGNFPQRMLKDYNGHTYWLSVNAAAFLPEAPAWLPRWLNLAAGYSTSGVLGGIDNSWQQGEQTIRRDDVLRQRQFYLTLDVDLTRIPTQSALLKTAFEIFNILKVPAPALGYEPSHGLRLMPLAF